MQINIRHLALSTLLLSLPTDAAAVQRSSVRRLFPDLGNFTVTIESSQSGNLSTSTVHIVDSLSTTSQDSAIPQTNQSTTCYLVKAKMKPGTPYPCSSGTWAASIEDAADERILTVFHYIRYAEAQNESAASSLDTVNSTKIGSGIPANQTDFRRWASEIPVFLSGPSALGAFRLCEEAVAPAYVGRIFSQEKPTLDFIQAQAPSPFRRLGKCRP